MLGNLLGRFGFLEERFGIKKKEKSRKGGAKACFTVEVTFLKSCIFSAGLRVRGSESEEENQNDALLPHLLRICGESGACTDNPRGMGSGFDAMSVAADSKKKGKDTRQSSREGLPPLRLFDLKHQKTTLLCCFMQ